MAKKLVRDDEIVYGPKVKGDERNYNWDVRFDFSGRYLGISQAHSKDAHGNWLKIERVLLSPEQVRALREFLDEYK